MAERDSMKTSPVEVMARAIFDAMDITDSLTPNEAETYSRAAASALAAAGYKILPREPTEAMCEAVEMNSGTDAMADYFMTEVYPAVWDAAP